MTQASDEHVEGSLRQWPVDLLFGDEFELRAGEPSLTPRVRGCCLVAPSRIASPSWLVVPDRSLCHTR
jgi:hypothetical protein